MAHYQNDRKVKHFCCLDQTFMMVFAQLTFRGTLRSSKPDSRVSHTGHRLTWPRATDWVGTKLR